MSNSIAMELQLIQAAERGHHIKLKKLIGLGVDIEASEFCRSSMKIKPLLQAALHGKFQCLQILLEAGADINAYDTLKNNALINAVSSRDIHCLKLLIDHNIEINHTDYLNRNALMREILFVTPNIEIGRLLIQSGIDLNVKNNDGLTAMDMARKHQPVYVNLIVAQLECCALNQTLDKQLADCNHDLSF